MNFSEAFQQTKHLVQFSPDGKFLASCTQYRLVIRDTESLQIVNLHTCLDQVQHFCWSPDSLFVMCAMYKRGIVQVWSIEQPEWTCKIDEGSAGLAACVWAPDSRHILTTTDFQLRMTLWSLTNKTISYIKYPKLSQGGVDFTSSGKYMALAERRDCKDYISIFDCSLWQLLNNFQVDTSDLAGLCWSPDSKVLCVWDSVMDYKVFLYSMDGRRIATYSAYDHALGVKSVKWSPTSQFLAIGSFDQKLRVLNHVTWKTVVEHLHPTTVESPNVVMYSEVESNYEHLTKALEKRQSKDKAQKKPTTTQQKISLIVDEKLETDFFMSQSKYEAMEPPQAIPTIKPDPEKVNPKLGVGTIAFSPDSRFIATRNDNMPNVVWIWDVPNLQLSVVLIQAAPVREIKWDPTQCRLAVCTGNGKLYLWSPAGCVSVTVPVAEVPFTVQRLYWHPAGTSLALIGSTHFCVCYTANSESTF